MIDKECFSINILKTVLLYWGMDVVWLKKDVRLRDHGPLAAAVSGPRPFCIVYIYEPDQLGHHSVHGSHVMFANEGLKDLDRRIGQIAGVNTACITCCTGEATEVFQSLHSRRKIVRLLAHEESGHNVSFNRDKRVRKFCKRTGISFNEFLQNGVTRGLKDRNMFTKNFNKFISKNQHCTPGAPGLAQLLTASEFQGIHTGIQDPKDLHSIAAEHRGDRECRQVGGETEAVRVFHDFIDRRAAGYSRGISSPNSAWSTCSRLSPYLTFGHISIRYVLHHLKRRQVAERLRKKQSKSVAKDPWLRSLAAFGSRMRWRSHFVQKFESECSMEHTAQCRAYDNVRRAPGDWNPKYFEAWVSGRTGFPMVDACMRCLEKHGWLNFRMRAMVVSFAAYNLFLDWRGIAPHLARVFLDYEPGIHYPQLQMQSGVTGINAMRVYSVTKQAFDQDPRGTFIRKYVPELRTVPTKYIHEPHKMPLSAANKHCSEDVRTYPMPIVEEKSAARRAKDIISGIKKNSKTRIEARRVFEKHGSRKGRAVKRSAPEKSVEKNTILDAFSRAGRDQSKRTKRDGAWTCKACTFVNCKAEAPVCEVCLKSR